MSLLKRDHIYNGNRIMQHLVVISNPYLPIYAGDKE